MPKMCDDVQDLDNTQLSQKEHYIQEDQFPINADERFQNFFTRHDDGPFNRSLNRDKVEVYAGGNDASHNEYSPGASSKFNFAKIASSKFGTIAYENVLYNDNNKKVKDKADDNNSVANERVYSIAPHKTVLQEMQEMLVMHEMQDKTNGNNVQAVPTEKVQFNVNAKKDNAKADDIKGIADESLLCNGNVNKGKQIIGDHEENEPEEGSDILSMEECRNLLRKTRNLPQDINDRLRITGVSFTADQIVIEYMEQKEIQQFANEKLDEKFSELLSLDKSRIELVKLSEYGSCSRTAEPGDKVCHPAQPTLPTLTTLGAYIVAKDLLPTMEDSEIEMYVLSCGHDKQEKTEVYVRKNATVGVQAHSQNKVDTSDSDTGQRRPTDDQNNNIRHDSHTADIDGDHPLHGAYLGQVKHVIFSDWNDYSVDCSLIEVNPKFIESFCPNLIIENQKIYISLAQPIASIRKYIGTPVQTYSTNTRRGIVYSYPAEWLGSNMHDRPIRGAMLIRTEESTDEVPVAVHGEGESGLLMVTALERGERGEGGRHVNVAAVGMLIAVRKYEERGLRKSYSLALPVCVSLDELMEHKFMKKKTLTFLNSE